jgi:hypothetical protein
MAHRISITQSLNHSITHQSISQFLPFSGFHHFADFAFHQIALEGADVADVELAVQVIGFVQKGAGQQLFSRFFVDLAVNILGADSDFVGTSDVLAEIGDAEASFTLSVTPFSVNDFRINENEFGVGLLLEGDVDDGDASGDADLRGGQADSVGGVHRLEHICDEFLQLFVENGHRFGGLLESRIAEFYDGIDHYC